MTASLKDIMCIKIFGAIDITINTSNANILVTDAMLFYLSNVDKSNGGYIHHDGMIWKLVSRSDGFCNKFISNPIGNTEHKLIDKWIFYSFANIVKYYFYNLLGSIKINIDNPVSVNDLSTEDADSMNLLFFPFIRYIETLCDIVVVFKEQQITVDPVDRFIDKIQSKINNENENIVVRDNSITDNKHAIKIVIQIDATDSLEHIEGIHITTKMPSNGNTIVFKRTDESIIIDKIIFHFYEAFEFDMNEFELDFKFISKYTDIKLMCFKEMNAIACTNYKYKYILITT